MATTATITLSADKVVPGQKFTAVVALTKDSIYPVRSVIPYADLNDVQFGGYDAKSGAFEVIIPASHKEQFVTIGANITLAASNKIVIASTDSVLCLNDAELSKQGAPTGGEVGSLQFNLVSASGLALLVI